LIEFYIVDELLCVNFLPDLLAYIGQLNEVLKGKTHY